MKFNRDAKVLALVLMAALCLFIFTGCATTGTATTTTADGTTTGSSWSMIIMIVLMIGVFYLFLIRPENKKKKQAEEMRSSLAVGDDITTIGGMMGKIVSIKDDSIVFETSEDRVRIQITKWAISTKGKQNTEEKK